MSRDIHCYCIQINTSEYGDSRIVQPSKTDNKDIVRMKGGEDVSILTGVIDVKQLRYFQYYKYKPIKEEECDFKPTPPQFNKQIVHMKIDKRVVDILNEYFRM